MKTLCQKMSHRCSITANGTLNFRFGCFKDRPNSASQPANHFGVILNGVGRNPLTNCEWQYPARKSWSFAFRRLRGKRPMHLIKPRLRHAELYLFQSIERRIETYHSYSILRTHAALCGLPCVPNAFCRFPYGIFWLPASFLLARPRAYFRASTLCAAAWWFYYARACAT